MCPRSGLNTVSSAAATPITTAVLDFLPFSSLAECASLGFSFFDALRVHCHPWSFPKRSSAPGCLIEHTADRRDRHLAFTTSIRHGVPRPDAGVCAAAQRALKAGAHLLGRRQYTPRAKGGEGREGASVGFLSLAALRSCCTQCVCRRVSEKKRRRFCCRRCVCSCVSGKREAAQEKRRGPVRANAAARNEPVLLFMCCCLCTVSSLKLKDDALERDGGAASVREGQEKEERGSDERFCSCLSTKERSSRVLTAARCSGDARGCCGGPRVHPMERTGGQAIEEREKEERVVTRKGKKSGHLVLPFGNSAAVCPSAPNTALQCSCEALYKGST